MLFLYKKEISQYIYIYIYIYKDNKYIYDMIYTNPEKLTYYYRDMFIIAEDIKEFLNSLLFQGRLELVKRKRYMKNY